MRRMNIQCLHRVPELTETAGARILFLQSHQLSDIDDPRSLMHIRSEGLRGSMGCPAQP